MSALSVTTNGGDSRLNLRLRNTAKARIERAASYAGKSVSAFILEAILPKAEETIEKHEIMRLNERDSAAFLAALDNPPPYNDALKDAIKAHGRLVISR